MSVPAKAMIVKEQPEKGNWNDNTVIRVEKCRNAVVMRGDSVLSSCGRSGDYMITDEGVLSEARVFWSIHLRCRERSLRPRRLLFFMKRTGSLEFRMIYVLSVLFILSTESKSQAFYEIFNGGS